MTPELLVELLKILYLTAILVGAMVSALLFRKRINKLSNRLCAVYILVMLLPLWNGYVSHSSALAPLSIVYLNYFYPWLFGPLLLLYLKALFEPGVTWHQSSMHFLPLPFTALFIFSLNFAYVTPGNAIISQAYSMAMYSQILGYVAYCWLYLSRQESHHESVSANLDGIPLAWPKKVLTLFTMAFVLDCLIFGLNLLLAERPHWLVDIFFIGESLLVVMLGIFALKQPELLFDRFVFEGNSKYRHSPLNLALAVDINNRLQALMQEQKCYLDNELTLAKLAAQLQVAPHHLSQVLSEQRHQNFYEFVNRYRIEHAKQLLASNDPQFGNILDIAFQVGFNNKTSFNEAFKRFTKLTPSQFKHIESA